MEKSLEYTLNNFNPKDIDSIFKVYESNEPYFILSGGVPATLNTIHENIEEVPPNTDPGFKHYSVVKFHEDIIGIIDYVEMYPDEDAVYIGLFLIDKPRQGLGHGKRFIQNFEVQMKEKGYHRIRLGVLKNNISGFKFWENLGFRFIKEVKSTVKPEKNWTVLVMEKKI